MCQNRFWLLHTICYDELKFRVKSWYHQHAQYIHCTGLATFFNKTVPSCHTQCISLNQARASTTSKHFSSWLRIRASFLVEEVQRGLRGCPSELGHSRSDALVQVAQPVMEQPPLLLVQCCQHLNITITVATVHYLDNVPAKHALIRPGSYQSQSNHRAVQDATVSK